MDKNRIIEWVINAVLVIVTTAVVTRLSLNQGKLGVTSKLKARFTPKFRAYIKLIFSLLMFIVLALNLYLIVRTPGSPTRPEVLFIAFGYSGVLVWIWLSLQFLKALTILKAEEKAQREREKWQPLIDQIRETREIMEGTRDAIRQPREASSGQPKDSIAIKPSDSQNPKE
jgi:hypothetical protein